MARHSGVLSRIRLKNLMRDATSPFDGTRGDSDFRRCLKEVRDEGVPIVYHRPIGMYYNANTLAEHWYDKYDIPRPATRKGDAVTTFKATHQERYNPSKKVAVLKAKLLPEGGILITYCDTRWPHIELRDTKAAFDLAYERVSDE